MWRLIVITILALALSTFCNAQSLFSILHVKQQEMWVLPNQQGTIIQVSFPLGPGLINEGSKTKVIKFQPNIDGLQIQTDKAGITHVSFSSHAQPICINGCTFSGTVYVQNSLTQIPGQISITKKGLGTGATVIVLEGNLFGTYTDEAGNVSQNYAYLHIEGWPGTDYLDEANEGTLTVVTSWN